MVVILIIIAVAVLVADTLFARSRLALRRRATQSHRPAWDVVRGTREGWRGLDDERSADEPAAEGADLGRLFGSRRHR